MFIAMLTAKMEGCRVQLLMHCFGIMKRAAHPEYKCKIFIYTKFPGYNGDVPINTRLFVCLFVESRCPTIALTILEFTI